MATSDALVSGETYDFPAALKSGSVTASAGTAITKLVEPLLYYKTRIKEFLYETGATAHDVYPFIPLVTSIVAANAADGQAVVNVTAPPVFPDDSAIAAGDYCVVQHSDGTYGTYIVSSYSALAITFTGNLTVDVDAGAKVWVMGVAANHADRKFTVSASKDRIVKPNLQTQNSFEPVLFYSANASNAGTLVYVDYDYIKTTNAGA